MTNHNPITEESGKQYRCRNGEILTLVKVTGTYRTMKSKYYHYTHTVIGGNLVMGKGTQDEYDIIEAVQE